MTPRSLPAPRPDAPTPGQRLAAYRRIALTIPTDGDQGEALDRIVRLLPERCPWLRAAAARRLTPDGRLTLAAATDPARFPPAAPLGEPIAGWAADRGEALVVVDRPAFRGPGPPGGSAAAAPIARLNGSIVGTLEVVAADPWEILDGDGQGLRQLGQALSRLTPADYPERRPPPASRSGIRPLIDAYLAAAGSVAVQTDGGEPAPGQIGSRTTDHDLLIHLACREAEAVVTLTDDLAGTRQERGDDPGAPGAIEVAAPTALDLAAAQSLYNLVHRELRRVLALCTDADLAREPRIGAWIAALTRIYRER